MTPHATGRRMKLGTMPAQSEGSLDGKTPRFREIQAMAQAAEQVGLDSIWLADHFIHRLPGQPEEGVWEALTLLSALASTTTRIILGPLVACTSFRNPALLAKMADSLDEISDGRFILGLGAGWHQPEYDAFGYPFDHLAGRFEEALQVIVPLLRAGHVDYHGQYYEARDCVLRPRGPSRSGPPIWIGAQRPRMLRLVARYADAWNTVWHLDPARVKDGYGRLLQACAEVGRDPETLELTAGTIVHILYPGETADPAERAIKGSPEEVAQTLRGFADAGVRHLIVLVTPEGVAGIERLGRVAELLDREPGASGAGTRSAP